MIYMLAVSLSIDALGIGISYAARKISIPISAKLVIASISIFISAISIFVGKSLFGSINASVSGYIGTILLIIMGIWIVFQGVRGEKNVEKEKSNELFSVFLKPLGITINVVRSPETCDLNNSKTLEPIEAIYMGIALSIDSIGVGLGSSIAGTTTLIMPILVGLFQMLFLYIGNIAGKKILKRSNIKSCIWNILSGIILISIALLRIM